MPPGSKTIARRAMAGSLPVSVSPVPMGLIADGIVWANVIIVSTPTLAFSPGISKTEEPVRRQALRAELAVQALDEGAIRRFAQS